MNSKRMLALLLLVAAGGIAAWWLARPRLSDRQQVVRSVELIRTGIQCRNLRRVMGEISKQYRDSAGYTRMDINRLGLAAVRSEGRIGITLSDFKVQIAGSQAQAQVYVDAQVGDGRPTARWSGRVNLSYQKEEGGWRLIRAEGWHGAEGMGE